MRREDGIPESVVAHQLGVDRKTVRKWTKRKRDEGEAGLKDRSSRPKNSPHRTPDDWRWAIESLRRVRFTQEHIAPTSVLLILLAVQVFMIGLVSEQISSLRFEGRK